MLLLGPWLWHDDFDGRSRRAGSAPGVVGGWWGPPRKPGAEKPRRAGDAPRSPICLGSIDLASVGQIMAAKPGQPRGVGIFSIDSFPMGTGSAYVPITVEDPRDAKPDGRILDAWESITGFRPQGDTIADLLWDHLTRGADPAQLDGPGLMMPDTRGRLELWLANQLVRSQRFVWGDDAQYTAKLQDVLTRRLVEVRQRAIAGECRDKLGRVDFASHRKFSDALCEKYAGTNQQKKEDFFEAIKPAAWDAAETLVTHETVITESFNQGDSTTLGPDLGWTEVTGDLQTVSNVCKMVGAGNTVGRARATTDLSSNDNYAQCTVDSAGATNASR
ncbi:MAG: hypothetical protein EXS05_09125, partial [Planctomycetaceae bacterium]|nr:hypothetical protein [Planctomycetaceae bacterium]